MTQVLTARGIVKEDKKNKDPSLDYIFMTGKSIQHMHRNGISLHYCNELHSYVYLEFVFFPARKREKRQGGFQLVSA